MGAATSDDLCNTMVFDQVFNVASMALNVAGWEEGRLQEWQARLEFGLLLEN